MESELKKPKEKDAKENRKHVESKTKAGKKTRTNICHQTMGKLYSTPSETTDFEKNKTAAKVAKRKRKKEKSQRVGCSFKSDPFK